MKHIIKRIRLFIEAYALETRAVAAVEASFIFPIMIVLFFGTLDVGRAIMTNQKTIKASQVAADLITRNAQVSDFEVQEAINAAKLSLEPYATSRIQFDIVSVRFNDEAVPEIVWRETTGGMSPIDNINARVGPIAQPGSGVVMVVARYLYEPIIAGFIIDEIAMEEVAFARGRRSEIVCRDGVAGCI